MPAIERFEDIDAWKKARELTKEVYVLTSRGGFSKDFGLRDQVRRASVSVMSNIAEGFDRGSDAEFRRFLFYSKGSVAEVRSQLYVALDVGYINQDQFNLLNNLSLEVSKLVTGFLNYLKPT